MEKSDPTPEEWKALSRVLTARRLQWYTNMMVGAIETNDVALLSICIAQFHTMLSPGRTVGTLINLELADRGVRRCPDDEMEDASSRFMNAWHEEQDRLRQEFRVQWIS